MTQLQPELMRALWRSGVEVYGTSKDGGDEAANQDGYEGYEGYEGYGHYAGRIRDVCSNGEARRRNYPRTSSTSR